MARTTPEEVLEIFPTNMDAGKILAFIAVATNLVTNVVAIADCTPAMTADELKEVERWLAAHFAWIRDPGALRARIGDAEAWHYSASVTTAWGKGLALTPYGQQAMVFDRSGALSSMGLRRATFRAAPRENSDDYTEGLD